MSKAMFKWPRWLQIITVICALLMIVGSILVGFKFENKDVMAAAFQRSGMSAAVAAQGAPIFIFFYRAVALLFCAIYAVAAYAALKSKNWAFWLIIIVFGVFGIGGVAFVPLRDTGLHGVGIAVSEATDGLGFLLGIVLAIIYVRQRRANLPAR